MRKLFFVKFFFLLLIITSCSEIDTPPSIENPQFPSGGCYIVGVELDFVDTCSYDFITNFISGFDSITVSESFLGSTFYLYADSGDYEYWLKYFDNDPTIDRIDANYPSPDSLILVIKLSGQKSVDEERERFLQIEHLTLLNIDIHRKYLDLDVPENSEERWKTFFEQYSFISYASVIGVCID